MAKERNGAVSRMTFLETLKSSYLLMIVAGLFALDLVIPDVLPYVDEVVLFILTILVGRWKGWRREKPPPRDVTPPPPPGDEDVL